MPKFKVLAKSTTLVTVSSLFCVILFNTVSTALLPNSNTKCKPSVFVISAPSGTGKTTLMNLLMQENKNIKKLVSVTTRAPRKTEKNGVDYKFISVKKYDRFLEKNAFFEAVESYGNKYGILRSDVEELLNSGHDVILDLNYKGASEFVENAKDKVNIVTIFIMPLSIAELKRRLVSRGTDSAAVISDRMTQVMFQLNGYNEYDYIITDTTLESCLSSLDLIYKSFVLKRESCKKGSDRMLSIENEYGKIKK
ncbi:MAG: guanylate kinase [Alphaproteobacteria bacterium]|nr:guanylate kinase [Rickettsiales bacterium]